MADEPLQFDRVESAAEPGAVVCVSCRTTIADAYYSASGKVFCARCRDNLAAALGNRGRFGRGLLWGLGGATLGGAIYFAVTAISGYELSLITILIGWLVGRAIQRGSGALGGRRYQVTAVLLTYLAVAGAYFGLALRAAVRDRPLREASSIPAADSADTGPAPVARPARPAGSLRTLVTLLGMSIALPIVTGLSHLPGSLLGLLIIGIGLYQAWQMNRRPEIALQGPFRIGPGDPSSA